MKKTAFFSKKSVGLMFSLLMLLIALVLPSAAETRIFTGSAEASAPITVVPKDKISILLKGEQGTVSGDGELKGSGTMTSLKLKNTFTVTVFSKNYNTELYIIYAVNGVEERVDGKTFKYACNAEEDYGTLNVKVFSTAEDKLLGEYTFELRYKDEGFFKTLYWKVAGNETVKEVTAVVKSEIPFAIWETFYVTVLSTVFSLILGMPLGVLLVAGDKNGVLPLPGWIMSGINVIINLLRSVPFLILMIMVIPISRLIIGTSVGTAATIVPLVFAAFPFVARLIETSLREVNPNIIEAAQSMGASPFKIIVKVMLPESVPSLVSNITIAVTTILGYSAMSGVIGGGGLGQIAINYGYYRYQYPTMVVAVILLIVMVQIFQSVGTYLAVRLDKRLK